MEMTKWCQGEIYLHYCPLGVNLEPKDIGWITDTHHDLHNYFSSQICRESQMGMETLDANITNPDITGASFDFAQTTKRSCMK